MHFAYAVLHSLFVVLKNLLFDMHFLMSSYTAVGIMSSIHSLSFFNQREPELLSGNDVLWTFVNFAGEDHTNFQTLVAFLNMLSTLV